MVAEQVSVDKLSKIRERVPEKTGVVICSLGSKSSGLSTPAPHVFRAGFHVDELFQGGNHLARIFLFPTTNGGGS